MSNNNVMFVSLMGITPVSYKFGGFFHRLPDSMICKYPSQQLSAEVV